jgi:hypothetical protein
MEVIRLGGGALATGIIATRRVVGMMIVVVAAIAHALRRSHCVAVTASLPPSLQCCLKGRCWCPQLR